MSTKSVFHVYPSLANKVAIKNQIAAAERGYRMLKLKRDALKIRLNETLMQRGGLADNFDEIFAEAIFSIAKASYLKTDFKPALIIGSDRADCWILSRVVWTIGLMLPHFDAVVQKPRSVPLTGLSSGGRQVKYIRQKFQEAFKVIVVVASLDNALAALNRSILDITRCLNGLVYVTMPRLESALLYILEQLDEEEREELFHLKRHIPQYFKNQNEGRLSSIHSVRSTDSIEGKAVKKAHLPLLLFMKRHASNAAQTLITGHYPGSQEIISPTDSLISGRCPRLVKRSKFNVSSMTVIVPAPAKLSKTRQVTSTCQRKQTKFESKDNKRECGRKRSTDVKALCSNATLVPSTTFDYVLPRVDIQVYLPNLTQHCTYESSAQTVISDCHSDSSELDLDQLCKSNKKDEKDKKD